MKDSKRIMQAETDGAESIGQCQCVPTTYMATLNSFLLLYSIYYFSFGELHLILGTAPALVLVPLWKTNLLVLPQPLQLCKACLEVKRD